jgi:hypothetical protein
MIITRQDHPKESQGRPARHALPRPASGAYLRREMAMARRVQHSLLPTLTPPPGLTVAACFRPAQAVGGDTYGLLHLPGGRLLVAGTNAEAWQVLNARKETYHGRAGGRGVQGHP